MRHTLFVAMKINASEIKSAPLEPTKLVAVPEVVIPILPIEVKTIPVLPPEVKHAPMAAPKKHFDYVEYSKEYRAAHKDVINKKQSDKHEANKQKMLAISDPWQAQSRASNSTVREIYFTVRA